MSMHEVIKKVDKWLFFLVQLKRADVPAKDLINFYTTCIRPILDYGAHVFHYMLQQYYLESLERVENFITQTKFCNPAWFTVKLQIW